MFAKIFELLSTITLISGVALTSLNIYPANVYVSIVGNAGWLVMGFLWKKWSLITIQFFVLAIYVIGLLTKVYN